MEFYNKNANKHAAYSTINAIILLLSLQLFCQASRRHPDMRLIQWANTSD